MKKKFLFIVFLVLCFILTSCNPFVKKIEEVGIDRQVVYSFDSVDSLIVEDINIRNGIIKTGASVNIYSSDSEKKVLICADEAFINNIVVSLNDGVLYVHGSSKQLYLTSKIEIDIYGFIFSSIEVSSRTKVNIFQNTLNSEMLYIIGSGSSKIKIYNSHEIENVEIDLSGSSSLDINYINSSKVKATLSGSSMVNYKLYADSIDLILSGSSSATLEGSGKNMMLKSSGASSTHCSKFVLDSISVNLSGASEAQLNSKEISGSASGASKIIYYSIEPKTDVNLSGSSTINKSK